MWKRLGRNDPRSYAFRNEILRYHGFASYREYLASDLWKSIKQLVLEKKGDKCLLCGGQACQVHHHEYTEKALLGLDLNKMWPVCDACHHAVEFTNGKKNDVLAARRTFRERHTAYCNRTGAYNVFSEEAQELHRAHKMSNSRCPCGNRPRIGSDLCRRCEWKNGPEVRV